MLTLLATLVPRFAFADIPGPYAPDADTLYLFHFDEAAGGTLTANSGSKGGVAYSVNEVSASATPPTVTTMLGAAGYSTNSPTSISFGNCMTNPTTGYLFGYDYNNSGAYQGDVNSGTQSADRLSLTNLNIGNGGQTPFTLEALIRPVSTSGLQEIICTDNSQATALRGFQFRINGGLLQFQLNGGTAPQALSGTIPTTGSNAFVAGTWYHVAFTYDGTTGRLYWSKLNQSSTAANLLISAALTIDSSHGAIQGPLTIGNENSGPAGERFLGSIDEVRVSSVARAANQMQFIASSTLILTCSTNKTVMCGGNWSFDAPTATNTCGGASVVITVLNTVTNGICPKLITRTWLATNSCGGNAQTCSQTVTNIDTTPPTISGLTNKSVNCGDTLSFDTPFISDACCGTNFSVLITTATNSSNPLMVTRTWRATDCCNNMATNSQTLTILSNCCLTISGEVITANPTNCIFTYTFTVQNDTTQAVSYVSMATTNGSYVFGQSLTYLNPPLQPGQSRQITQTITAPAYRQICFYLGLHNATLVECCSLVHCVTLPGCCTPCDQSRTYSTASDFTNNGVLMNLIYTNGALRFPTHTQPFPFVYIPCSWRGTVVKIDINSGAVLGEYYTAPAGISSGASGFERHNIINAYDQLGSNPSRTTVDLIGNVWVGNRSENRAHFGTVTKIALIIGGTRGNKANDQGGLNYTFVPDPNGNYLQPPFKYNSGAVDRDGDGLIKTSRRLGDILEWNGPELDNGRAATADDECITSYTVLNKIIGGIRTIAVDRNNDVWVAHNGGVHQKVKGATGLPMIGTEFTGPNNSGGYGGLIDGNNVLWSARGVLNHLLRVDLTTGLKTDLDSTNGNYGLSIDPCNGNIWHATVDRNLIFVRNPSGTVLNPLGYSELSPNSASYAQGVTVTESGSVWIAHSLVYPNNGANTIGHLRTTGFAVGTVDLRVVSLPGSPFGFIPPGNEGPHGPTGVAVDSNGKIWVSCFHSSRVMRVDPNLGSLSGGFRVGAVDLVVDLNAEGGPPANPYTYSDKTGIMAVGVTSATGFWDFIQQSCGPGTVWGTISWTACSTNVKVEVRAADKVTGLPGQPWKAIKNGKSFCGGFFSPYSLYPVKVQGQYLEVRVTLKRGTASPCDPSTNCLQNLTIKCCSPSGPDVGWDQLGPVRTTNNFTLVTNRPVVVNWDGQPITLTWSTNGVVAQTDFLPGGSGPTNATVDFINAYPPGSNSVELVASGTNFDHLDFETYVIVGDIEPPVWSDTPAISIVGYNTTLPDLITGLTTNNLSDDWTSFADIVKLQSPPAGTVVTQGIQMVQLTATDQAGNTSTNFVPFALAPVLAITSPVRYEAASTASGMPVTIQIASNITDVVQVRYYLNGNLVASSFTPPFGLTLTNVAAGSYDLQVEAVNGSGQTSRSLPVLISFVQLLSANLQLSASGGTNTLTWPAGWTLQSATQVTGPWTNVPAATSPFTMQNTNPQRFFRLVSP